MDMVDQLSAPDPTEVYNTPLSPGEEARFQQWLAKSGRGRDLYDYDMRGAWKADAKAAGNGHLPDTWKKPNHPTFSVESIYNGPQTSGGQWQQAGKNWRFIAAPSNLKYRSQQELQDYFSRVEPGNELVLPPAPAANSLAGFAR